MSKILLGNPKGALELGNPNISAELKLHVFFIYSSSRNSLPRD